jgi:hypothetical protein
VNCTIGTWVHFKFKNFGGRFHIRFSINLGMNFARGLDMPGSAELFLISTAPCCIADTQLKSLHYGSFRGFFGVGNAGAAQAGGRIRKS